MSFWPLKRQTSIAVDGILTFYFYLSKKIRLDFFVWLDSLETSSLIFSEKQCKKYLWMLSAGVVIDTLTVNPIARWMAKTRWSFGRSECNRVNMHKMALLFILYMLYNRKFSLTSKCWGKKKCNHCNEGPLYIQQCTGIMWKLAQSMAFKTYKDSNTFNCE